MPPPSQDGDPSLILGALCGRGQVCAGQRDCSSPARTAWGGASCIPGASLEVRLTEGLPQAGSRACPVIPEQFWSLVGAQEVGCQLETVTKPRGGPDSPRPSRQGFRPARPHRESSPALSPVWLCDPEEPGLPARAGQCAFGKAPWVRPRHPCQRWPRATPSLCSCVWRKGLQPGGPQSLTVMDGPGAPGYCQGVGSRCPSDRTKCGTGFRGRRRELWAAAGQGGSLQNLQFPWHFHKGPHASDLAGGPAGRQGLLEGAEAQRFPVCSLGWTRLSRKRAALEPCLLRLKCDHPK